MLSSGGSINTTPSIPSPWDAYDDHSDELNLLQSLLSQANSNLRNNREDEANEFNHDDQDDCDRIDLKGLFDMLCPPEERADIESFVKHYPGLTTQYIPIKHIGEGTFSTVYKVLDTQHCTRDNTEWLHASRQDGKDALLVWMTVWRFECLRVQCQSGKTVKQRRLAKQTLREAGLTSLILWLREWIIQEWIPNALKSSRNFPSSPSNANNSNDFTETAPGLKDSVLLAKAMAQCLPHFLAIKRINATSAPVRILDELSYLRVLMGKHNVIPVVTAARFEDQVLVVFPYFALADDFRLLLSATPHSAASSLSSNGWKAADVACYMRLLFEALAWIHQQGIMHRDIKPSNFMFASCRGQAASSKCQGCLVDFGLAQVQIQKIWMKNDLKPVFLFVYGL